MKTVSRTLFSALLLIAVSKAHSAPCDFVGNFGKIQRIYPQFYPGGLTAVPSNAHKPGTFFRLDGSGLTNALTSGGSYHISANGTSSIPPVHTRGSLYRSMHDLIVEAAKNGWTVHVRTNNCSSAQSVV
jgi:hypothetical protein